MFGYGKIMNKKECGFLLFGIKSNFHFLSLVDANKFYHEFHKIRLRNTDMPFNHINVFLGSNVIINRIKRLMLLADKISLYV